jgi:hypothetical protein
MELLVTDSLLKLFMGMLGVFLYSLFKSRQFVTSKDFSIAKMHNDYKRPGLWAFTVLCSIVAILQIEPEAGNMLQTFVGVDLQNTKGSFLLLGMSLLGLLDTRDDLKETSSLAIAMKQDTEPGNI